MNNLTIMLPKDQCSFSSKQARQRADVRQGQSEEPQNAPDKKDDRKHGRLLLAMWMTLDSYLSLPWMILDVVIRDKNAELPSVCFAWGRDGHRITAFIAAKYLTPQAAAAVKDLCHVRNVG